jgi:hypothetical protein
MPDARRVRQRDLTNARRFDYRGWVDPSHKESVMPRVEMVRCFLTRETTEQGDARYIPADIYDMWCFLMQRVHQLEINAPSISLWVAEDVYKAQHAEEPSESVIEVKFRYLDMGEVGRLVTRYFPEDGFDEIFGMFRRHFPDDDRMQEMTRRRGFFLAGSSARPLTER